MSNVNKTVEDYYGEKVYCQKFGYGKLKRVYGDELFVEFEKWGTYIFRSNPFADGTVSFENSELLSGFLQAYKNHVSSADGSHEIYDIWFRRGS